MLGKILILAFLILVGVIAYEYYFQHLNTTPSTNANVRNTTVASKTITYHEYNISATIEAYGNTTGSYIYPIKLPAYGNVSLTVLSNYTYTLKVYVNNTLLFTYHGAYLNKKFEAGGNMELYFTDFNGSVNIQLNEIY